MLYAPEEIDNKRYLGHAHDPGGDRDRPVPLKSAQAPDFFGSDIPALSTVVPAPVHAEHSLKKHRQKDHVHADERGPKMHFPPEFIHHSTSRFRKPKIDTGKKSEDRSGRDNVVKMRDHVIGVVQIEVRGVERERDAS